MRVSYQTTAALLVCVFLLSWVEVTTSAPANKCLLKCMLSVLKCKRDAGVGLTTGDDCCDKYTLCYFACEPDATEAPSCRTKKYNTSYDGKRGSWSKRGSWNKREPPMTGEWADRGQQLSEDQVLPPRLKSASGNMEKVPVY
ncbi:hypothetical protein EGW08_020657 [Elysia chlorotica]|uniref:WAP domain-containing protein n=1 Tax=Elysia chlorotica TaxID=188477 RepID=A0A433SQP3_ELYCH|nr:hypothetical protein EGW08_020657 [Elysia chlorotica]